MENKEIQVINTKEIVGKKIRILWLGKWEDKNNNIRPKYIIKVEGDNDSRVYFGAYDLDSFVYDIVGKKLPIKKVDEFNANLKDKHLEFNVAEWHYTDKDGIDHTRYYFNIVK